MIAVLVVAAVLLLALVIPISSFLTLLFFRRRPFVGSMYASIQLVSLAFAKLLVGKLDTTLNLDGRLASVDVSDSTLTFSTGGSELTGLCLLGAAVIIFAISAHYQDRRSNYGEETIEF